MVLFSNQVTLSRPSLSRLVVALCGVSVVSLGLVTLDFAKHNKVRRQHFGNDVDVVADDVSAPAAAAAAAASAPVEVPAGYVDNNWGDNDHLLVREDRQRDAAKTELKTILMWNDAYGVREYDIGHGREPFYKYGCPETRCYATDDRYYLPSVDQFDALLIHQRGIDWKDMPESRSPGQRWIHWNCESPQYISVDIARLNGMFNWTMTFKRDSDFYLPYGRVRKVREHPEGEELKEYIREFGRRNRHLAAGRTGLKAAWFVSHCATQARRERYARMMQNYMDVDVYGKCGKFKCERDNETACYLNMEKEYRFYLSFENSICDDYVTEKFFNILRYNVIPITYGGADFSSIAPPHSSVNALAFGSVKKLVRHLRELAEDDARFAEYFWWRDFYEVRNSMADRAQAYCDLCARLHDPDAPPKVYEDMFKWWVTDSHCKKLRSAALQ